jgi:hypothetical protein
MSIYLIAIAVIYIFIAFDSKSKIIRYNNKFLEQKTEIIRINGICGSLSIPYIQEDIILISHKVVNLVVIFISAIISFGLVLIFLYIKIPPMMNNFNTNNYHYINNVLICCLIYIIVIYILLIIIYIQLYKKYFGGIQEKINKIEEIINKKKIEINLNLRKKLMSVIDENDNIEIIDNAINEYLLNYSYLSVINKKIDKNKFINQLKRKLMNDKKNELMNDMKNNLKDTILITQEIVKTELEVVSEKMENYENSLNSKLNQVILLSQANSIIIDII